LVNVFATEEKSFRAPNQQNAGLADRFSRRLDSLDRKIDIVKPLFLSIGCVLNREASNAGRDAESYALGHIIRIIGITIFEIRIHRNIGRFDQLADVRQHLVASDRTVGQSTGERETG
jgi:hypothetical protein